MFSDPDAGDTQTAFDVQIFDSTGSALIYESGWVGSNATSFTVPSGVLTRGTVYAWRVAAKDNKGGPSAFSPFYYIKPNFPPALTLTSYSDGQQISDNVLTFTWTYADADGQGQTAYRLQGSRDNWATIGYDSGVINSNAMAHTTTAVPDGTWSFKVVVSDGMEWSAAAQRSGLRIPNAYEPNDANTQAFPVNYNTAYTSAISTATDVDFFKYVAPATGIDRVSLTMPADTNYDVYVYDSNMNFVAAGVSTAMGAPENIIYQVNAGATYNIKVVGASGSYSTTNAYAIKVSKLTLNYNTGYQFDANGNITGKQTTSN
jgi:hypothetical protein